MRMVRRFLLFLAPVLTITSLIAPTFVLAAGTTISAQTLLPKVKLFFPSRTGTFTEGSTFEVPILLDTNNNSVNTVELYIQFDPHKLAIVKPAGDKSIISIWLQPPSFSNTDGRAKIVGAIPNGISTASGVVTTITFKAIETGEATVKIAEGSRVLANNGSGTDLLAQFDSAHYSITPVPPEGLKVYSETHPFDDHWYNNNSPVLSWEADPKIAGVSYIMDHEPFTIPDNTLDANDNVKSYENLEDGLWYFHIKAQKNKIWGATTHFLVRIDTTPPAAFTPTHDSLAASVLHPTLVSFFTTDALSGIDHYEVGVIEQNASSTPLFVQTDSPYQVPASSSGNVKVIIKAYDRAGNVQIASTDIAVTASIMSFLTEHLNQLVMLILLLILLMIILHYIFRHRIFHKIGNAFHALNEDERPAPVAKPAPAVMPVPVFSAKPEVGVLPLEGAPRPAGRAREVLQPQNLHRLEDSPPPPKEEPKPIAPRPVIQKEELKPIQPRILPVKSIRDVPKQTSTVTSFEDSRVPPPPKEELKPIPPRKPVYIVHAGPTTEQKSSPSVQNEEPLVEIKPRRPVYSIPE